MYSTEMILNSLGFKKPSEEDTGTYGTLQHASIQHFSRMELEKATDNFSLENKIGGGGFGVVYLVILLDCVF